MKKHFSICAPKRKAQVSGSSVIVTIHNEVQVRISQCFWQQVSNTARRLGFDAAIHAAFSQTEIQNSIIHQLRNSSKYVSYKDLRVLMADLKAVYAAAHEQARAGCFGRIFGALGDVFVRD